MAPSSNTCSLAYGAAFLFVLWLIWAITGFAGTHSAGWVGAANMLFSGSALAGVGWLVFQQRGKKTGGTKSDGIGFAGLAGLTILFVWLAMVAVICIAWSEGNSELMGQWGDAFGGLNTLFSGLAIVGVVYTLYRQHEDSVKSDSRHAEVTRLAVVDKLIDVTARREVAAQDAYSFFSSFHTKFTYAAAKPSENSFISLLNDLPKANSHLTPEGVQEVHDALIDCRDTCAAIRLAGGAVHPMLNPKLIGHIEDLRALLKALVERFKGERAALEAKRQGYENELLQVWEESNTRPLNEKAER